MGVGRDIRQSYIRYIRRTLATMMIAAMAAAMMIAPMAHGQADGGTGTADGIQQSDVQQGALSDGRNIELSITVWGIDLNPRQTLSDEQLLAMLRERARVGISAMLYGYRFDYVLENRARGTAERFTLEPVRRIADGDPQLRLADRWRSGEQLFARFTYRADGAQAAWWNAWHAVPTTAATGDGAENVWASADEQRTAMERALQDAVTDYLRATYKQKPKRARGSLLLRDGGRMWLDSGQYLARVALLLRIDEVEEFRVF